jgi:8-hydroxy-5-deazaflavin:NADPH oxidoreductase
MVSKCPSTAGTKPRVNASVPQISGMNKQGISMKIGIVGVGNIGGTLARKLVAAGHDVKVANSRGPDSLRDLAREIGASAVAADEAVAAANVIILSIPFANIPGVAALLRGAPDDAVVIDTSNYYAFRDKNLPGFADGDIESLWVTSTLGRPVIKAWNAVLAGSLADKGRPVSDAGRIALPIAGDKDTAKAIAATLVDETGFDAVDAGRLEDSWRMQPGNPAFCTDLNSAQLRRALSSADRKLAPRLRDIGIDGVFAWGQFNNDDILYLYRALTRSPARSGISTE